MLCFIHQNKNTYNRVFKSRKGGKLICPRHRLKIFKTSPHYNNITFLLLRAVKTLMLLRVGKLLHINLFYCKSLL